MPGRGLKAVSSVKQSVLAVMVVSSSKCLDFCRKLDFFQTEFHVREYQPREDVIKELRVEINKLAQWHDTKEVTVYSVQQQDRECHPQQQDEEYDLQQEDHGHYGRQSPSVPRPATAPNHGREKQQGRANASMNDFHPGSSSQCSPAPCQSAAFGARDALEHIKAHRDSIQKVFGTLQATPIILAGFNETHIREGVGLLQEIHILTGEDVDLDKSALAEVGKACSPFPSLIFKPSGKCFQPPLYDQNGMAVSFSTLSGSICKLRYNLAVDRALSLPETGRVVGHTGGTPRHATSGDRLTPENRLPTPRRSGNVIQSPVAGSQSGSRDQSTSIEEGEGRTTQALESAESGNAREGLSRGPEDALPEDPPGHGGSSAQHLRRVHLALLIGIRQALATDSSRQEMQLQADFGFQVRPVITFSSVR
jgi:hypothetical protein